MACCRRRVARPSCGAPSSGCSGVIGAPNSRVTINILYLRPRRGARLCRITAHYDQHGEVAVKCSLHSPRETPAENSLSHRFVVGLALPNTSPAAPFLGTFRGTLRAPRVVVCRRRPICCLRALARHLPLPCGYG